MSGSSYDCTCPRCGSPNMDCYTDHKPVGISQGRCLVCGLNFYTTLEVLDPDVLKESREQHIDDMEEIITWPELTDEQKKKCKAFDGMWL